MGRQPALPPSPGHLFLSPLSCCNYKLSQFQCLSILSLQCHCFSSPLFSPQGLRHHSGTRVVLLAQKVQEGGSSSVMRPESTGRARGAGNRVERLVRSPSHALTHPHATHTPPSTRVLASARSCSWTLQAGALQGARCWTPSRLRSEAVGLRPTDAR
ncbi:hypothetical protein IEO21_03229 [Rhodonia placenta]|uniref:Uncharacterized protein n=1 Tax=Rhodonia placenta TaxID=104341 RepID=A0A8H7P697_9APHY|nr:hypothetical protein IEO21_03229 [Postia placenta]